MKDRYIIPEWSGWHFGANRLSGGRVLAFLTNNHKDVAQGTLIVDGVPLGGYNVKPIRFLDEREYSKPQ